MRDSKLTQEPVQASSAGQQLPSTRVQVQQALVEDAGPACEKGLCIKRVFVVHGGRYSVQPGK